VLLAHAVLLSASRLILAPTLLVPGGRSDLLLAITPALFSPLLVLRRPASDSTVAVERARRTPAVDSRLFGLSIVCTIAAFYWLAMSGLAGVQQWRYPLFVPASEMTAAIDWIADKHTEQDGRGAIDLGYDLERGLERIPVINCQPERSWYSIGRQYDWLLLRRHDLNNVHEGSCDRGARTRWQIGYRGSPVPIGMTIVQTFEHLEIRFRAD
jgi:hypothetical protein